MVVFGETGMVGAAASGTALQATNATNEIEAARKRGKVLIEPGFSAKEVKCRCAWVDALLGNARVEAEIPQMQARLLG